MTLATLAALATLMTGAPCAAIDNTTNTAAYAAPGQAARTTTYSDQGERLVYHRAPGRRANGQWMALHAAEASLSIGKPGPKTRLACIG